MNKMAFSAMSVALAASLAGCTAAPHAVVSQSLALSAGPRSIALAPPAPGATPFMPDGAVVKTALTAAGYQPRPAAKDVRFLLVLTTTTAPRKLGALIPAEGADAAMPPHWIVRPRRGLGGGTIVRVTAVLLDAPSGRELWRGAISAPRHRRKPDLDGLTTSLLAELPRG